MFSTLSTKFSTVVRAINTYFNTLLKNYSHHCGEYFELFCFHEHSSTIASAMISAFFSKFSSVIYSPGLCI